MVLAIAGPSTKVNLLILAFVVAIAYADLSLTILHTGDTRSNFLPVDTTQQLIPCKPSWNVTAADIAKINANCLGGWDSRKTFVDQVRAKLGPSANILLLDSGDTLSGTLFFQTFKGTMAGAYHANLNYTAWNVGVRDWDGGGNVLSDYANRLTGGGVRVVSTTLNFTGGGVLYTNVLNSFDLSIDGKIVRIIGFANRLTDSQARLPTGVSLFLNDVQRVREVVGSANYVIMVSKANSLEDEKAVMDGVPGVAGLRDIVDVVVGSYNGKFMSNLNCDKDPTNCVGPYPYYNPSPAYIIAAPPSYGRGVGYLNVTFDDAGTLTSYEGDMIWLNRTIYTPDAVVEKDLYDRNLEVQQFASVVVGSTEILLNGDGTSAAGLCRRADCNFGLYVADLMRDLSKADIALVNAGIFRANLTGPDITYGDILRAIPFPNTLATFDVRGITLVRVLNNGVGRVGSTLGGSARFLQVSGLTFSWNPTLATGDRVIEVRIFDKNTGRYEDLDITRTYTVASTNFVWGGGDDYNLAGFPGETLNAKPYGPFITDVVLGHLSTSPNVPRGPYENASRIISTDSTDVFRPPVVVFPTRSLPEGLSIAFVVLTGVFAAVPVILSGYLFHHRKHAAIVISSPVFVQVIISGVLLGYLALFIYLLVLNDGGCMAFPWLGNYAFVIIFGSLFAKTWRIDRIFSRTKKLRSSKRPITNQTLFLIIGIMLLIETLIMGLWQGLSPLKYTLRPDTGRGENRYICSSKNGVYFFAASVAYKGILMIWGMYLVIKTRNIDSDFRESTFIGWIIYAVFLTCAIIVTISLILKGSILAVYILTVIGFWIVLGAVIGALFIPKVIDIWADPTLAWATYFQRRADAMRANGAGSYVSSYHSSSGSTDNLKDRLRRMKHEEKVELLGDFKNRHTAMTNALAEIEKDIKTIEASIAKKSKA